MVVYRDLNRADKIACLLLTPEVASNLVTPFKVWMKRVCFVFGFLHHCWRCQIATVFDPDALKFIEACLSINARLCPEPMSVFVSFHHPLHL
jgi:hypothetical protein